MKKCLPLTLLALAAVPGLTRGADDKTEMTSDTNPFFVEWTTPYEAPPFDKIKTEHFLPAIERGIAEHAAEVDAIANNPEPATFQNTLQALETAGETLGRTLKVFFYLTSSQSTPELEDVEMETAPMLARHYSSISLNQKLFQRIKAVYENRQNSGLDAEQQRLAEVYYINAVMAGADLDEAGRARLAEINEELAKVNTEFSQNLLADESQYVHEVQKSQLAGVPDAVVHSMAQAAEERGMPGKHVVVLSRSIVDPILTYADNRDLRKMVFDAWAMRGRNGNDNDNRETLRKILALRIETAKLMGYDSYAAYATADKMAKNPERVMNLLTTVWDAAKKTAAKDQAEMQQIADKDDVQIKPWDWLYYQEKVRKAKYDLDAGELSEYLQLDKMIEAKFWCAHELYGLNFTPVNDIPMYRPDVRVYNVTDNEGRHVALFVEDLFARVGKRSGAWMNELKDQYNYPNSERPIIGNNNNIARGNPTLLDWDATTTLFHEFGHGLHGMLSQVTYESLSGTNVDRDLVEFPSQLNENWIAQPAVLRKFATHYKTGKPMPDALIEKLQRASHFGEGYAQVSYLASALLDMEYHMLDSVDGLDPVAFEAQVLKKYGMPDAIAIRHSSTQFSHSFSDAHYAAGYYTYIWSAQLAADGFAAFEETGDIFNPEVAGKLKKYVLSAGNRQDPETAYKEFRGHLPTAEPLLRHLGFLTDTAEAPVSTESAKPDTL